MKNKNMGGGGGAGVLSTQPDQHKKAPMQKMRKKCKTISNIENFFLPRFGHLAFYKIHNRYAPIQYAKYVCFSFF